MNRKHILVADDEPMNRKLLSEVLDACGYRITAVENGAEAAALLATNDFDAIITDLHMPGGDGIELARQVRRSGKAIPIFLVTIDGESLAREDRAQVVLKPKPLSIRKLLEALETEFDKEPPG